MKILLEINDNKAPFLMELLHNYPFVSAHPFNGANVLSGSQAGKKKKSGHDAFAKVRGIWADRNIDGISLRKQAWGIDD